MFIFDQLRDVFNQLITISDQLSGVSDHLAKDQQFYLPGLRFSSDLNHARIPFPAYGSSAKRGRI